MEKIIRGLDVDSHRRKFLFSQNSIQNLMSQPFNLFLEWMLMTIGEAVAVNRLAYLRNRRPDEKSDLPLSEFDLIMAAGHGYHLPMVGSTEVQIEPHVFRRLQAGAWVTTPTPDIGWDAFYAFHINGKLCVLAVDDTNTERIFSDADRECLLVAANWFGDLYNAKDEIIKTKEQATKDPLTHLPNQKQCILAIKKVILQIAKKEIPAACIAILDLDNFKACNDRFGHFYGDVILKSLAEILNAYPHIFKGRYGGEEFLLVLPGKLEQSLSLLKEILDKFTALDIRPEGRARQYQLSFSAGLHEINIQFIKPDYSQTTEENFKLTDALMYEAKDRGKSQICTLLDLTKERAQAITKKHIKK